MEAVVVISGQRIRQLQQGSENLTALFIYSGT
jgi:hypothetical protein